MRIVCVDGTIFDGESAKCTGSVAKVRDRAVNHPPVVGQYPVCVEQSGQFRLFTFSKKIARIEATEAAQ